MSGDTTVDIVWEPSTQLSSLDCWDYSIELDCLRGPEDLQLAAELGKTLLERNKELENCIKLHQCTIDDQAQEIEYMKKQTAALREVNDSRLKIYEQLEVSIQDLERANHRLALENANDKKQIKSQSITIETLEARVDELQKKFDEVNRLYEALLREQTKSQSSDVTPAQNDKTADMLDGSTQNIAVSPRRSSTEEEARIQQLASAMVDDEDVAKLLQQLQEARSQRTREQEKVSELKEQLDALLLEHAQMEEQLSVWKAKAQDMKNLQDEINTLEEVRQGNLCGRCLRGTDSRTQDELSVMLDQEEDDEISLAESLADSVRDTDLTLQEFSVKSEIPEEDNCNTYRELVEKYEALLKVQQPPAMMRRNGASNLQANISTGSGSNGNVSGSNGNVSGSSGRGTTLSLQEELQMSGEFSGFNSGQSEPESNVSIGPGHGPKKPFACTPTDFSEAETSSSGFSDETSNKSTQTDGRPGSFLCSISADDDCRFSIYDDSSTFESRFHKTPEYRKLFSEIFEVLKRAADAKDKGTELPLLEDGTTPVLEDAPSELTDDTRSVVSLAVSSVASEPVFRVRTPVFGRKDLAGRESGQAPNQTPQRQQPAPRQPLEYLSVQVRKKTSGRKARRAAELPSTPDVIPTPNPRVVQLKSGGSAGGGRRRFRPLSQSELSDGVVWNGNTAHFYPSKSPRGRRQPQDYASAAAAAARDRPSAGFDYKPSTASEEVAKLRRLEMSYAEALRMPNKSKPGNRSRKNH